ncbi:hypothetical protein R80B4_02445 [Fibrobacteres bacterium R8-0-B4]
MVAALWERTLAAINELSLMNGGRISPRRPAKTFFSKTKSDSRWYVMRIDSADFARVDKRSNIPIS